ncbi:hypothetical protein GGTG_00838 [Gaeumannomyces tritici R3-111a-1]|uniref:VWFA domain-containing protein n=1 Tax=Gaeumannomyces tritici (strain R3-111a-1) TaxID=644352 RepID=J3NHV2_GAET3|nr:hypothetical protein GGTG_00838 [Gaeumannomyces tritici R3-111a-1]EJT80845.1 hypothetical protein GGTG_00838 [Gaeumannomyces tritici R3-111a-1]
MKVASLISAMALAASPILASSPASWHGGHDVVRRDTGKCNIQLAASNGGRKVAIVLDSSGSMSTTDPSRLRVVAGKALNNQLVPSSAATGGKQADVVTVVDFDGSARVIYPLGDPAQAGSSFDKIDSSGGTFIADGVKKATAELTKPGNDPTADRSGIVVLTDGEDSDTKGLIAAIEAARAAGIRVSFGFLAPTAGAFKPDLLSTILKTGGSYASFATADAIQSWLFLILSNGITASDRPGSASSQPLLPGITVAKLSGGGQSVAFSYAAQAGEQLVFSVSSLSAQELSAELSAAEGGSGSVVGKNSTTARSKTATVAFSPSAAGDLKLVVAATNSTAEGVFQVSLNSSLGISGCNLTTQNPGGSSGGNTTTLLPTYSPTNPSTPTGSLPPVVTAAAARLSFPALALGVAAMLF